MRLRLPIIGHGFGPGGRLYFRLRSRRIKRRTAAETAKVASHVVALESLLSAANSIAIFVLVVGVSKGECGIK